MQANETYKDYEIRLIDILATLAADPAVKRAHSAKSGVGFPIQTFVKRTCKLCGHEVTSAATTFVYLDVLPSRIPVLTKYVANTCIHCVERLSQLSGEELVQRLITLAKQL